MLKYFSSILLFIYPTLLNAGSIDSATQYFYKGNYKQAGVEHYLNAYEQDQNNSEILFRIGLCHYLLGSKEKSLPFFAAAKKKDPKIFNGKIKNFPLTECLQHL